MINFIPILSQQGNAAPNSGNNLSSMISALQQNQMKPLQTGQDQNQGAFGAFNKGLGNLADDNKFSQGMNAMFTGSANPFAAGGVLSPQSSYINDQGDLMSAGEVTPG